MKRINTLIFDVSGVLIDDLYAVWLADKDALSFYGYNYLSIEEFKQKFKLPIVEYYRSIGIPKEAIEKVDRKWYEFYSHYQHLVRLFPEVKDVLSQLKTKGLRLGISSNTPNKFLKKHLHRFKILLYFDAIVGREDCDEEKPSPKPILVALSKLNANPKTSAYVGDMEEDMIAGKKAGVYTIAVDRKEAYQPIWKLKLHNPDYIITDLNDLLNIV